MLILSIASTILALRPLGSVPLSTVSFSGISVELRLFEGAIAIGIAMFTLKSH